MASGSDHETSDANGEAMFPQASAHSHQYDRVSDSRGIRRDYHENAVTRKDGFPEDARNTDSSPRVTGSTGARRKTFARKQQRDDQKKPIGTRRYHEHQHIGNSRNNGTRGGEFPRADNYRYNGETKRRSGLDSKVAGSGVREANRSSNAKSSTNSVKQTREGKKPTRNQSERIRSAPKGRERDEGRQGEIGSTQTAFRQRGKDTKARFEGNGDHGKENGKTHARVSCATSADNTDESQRRQGQGNQQASKQNPHQVKSRIKTTPFSEQELQSFLEEAPSDVLSKLVKKKDECMALLNQDKLSENTLILTLRVFSSLCELDPVSAYTKQLNIVLTMIECSLFLSKHLTRYLVSLPLKQPQKLDGCDGNDDQSHGASDVSMILRVLQLFLQHKQSGYSEVGAALILLERVVAKDCLMGELQQLKIGYNEVEQSQKSAKQRAMEKPPPNNFRDIPIFPESAEIRQVTKPFLRKNIIQGRYENVEHYLDVQFRLLREDFVAPLREGISEFLSDTTGRPQDIRVYKCVSIVKRTMGENGFVHTLQFDTRPLKRVRWESSKRLIYGSFVCLTRDNFKHIVGATVENRNLKDVEEGLFDVRFLTETPSTMGPFIMAESAAYFEACRHVLQGLQQVDESNFPFKKYIVDVASAVDAPEYLRDDDSVTYDLESLVGSDCHRRVVPILTLESWPSADDLHLDESQKAALQTALTKEFAIIQGPPGTGKTYIGLKIIEVLLHNRPRNQDLLENASPVLVVCYTNHALDQFLEGIIAFGEEEIVRVGSRSNSEALKWKNLSCLRRDRRNKEKLRGSYRERRNTEHLRGLLRESDDSIRRIILKLDLPTKVLLNVEALGRYMTRGEYGALSLRWQGDEQPQRDLSEKLLNWLQVFDMTNEEYSGHPSRQHEEKPQVRKHTEFVNVEDRSQLDRQIEDSYDDRSEFQECRQTIEAQIFRENAAYSLRGIKRCGKNQKVLPVVELQKPDVMTDEEASSIERVWYLMIRDRWRLYRLWVKRYIQDHEAKLQNEQQRYEAISRDVHRERRNTGRLRGLLRESDESIRRIILKLDLPTKVLLNVEALGRYMTHGEYGALSLRWQGDEQPQRDLSEKLLNWLQVFDMTNEEYSGHPSRQHEEKPQVRKHTEFVNVEDRSQHDRQIDDSYDDRSEFQECRQTIEAQIFWENAAYSLRGIKRCGKYKKVPPVVELQKPDVMTDEEASSIERVWYLMIWDRWRLYRLWVKRYIQDHEAKLQNERQRYEVISRDVQDMNVEEDLEILRGASVIGMTTTGAAKHRTVLQRLGPRIVVVEEAAEVLEAHIITTLTANCQHLILIGDHQQLKPNPTVYRLARWFNLDTSLFERMINNGVPCQSLTHQHRMRPEISTVMKNHFYHGLQDDKSVWNMDDVRGVAHNMFFIDHQHFEDEDDDNRTRSNQYEAEVLVELCRYLLRQGYKSSQITILTTYTGQLFCFRRLMDRATFEGVRVCVVDNYQGEENDIILLSLVRSNEDGSIGFLRTTNRVCVALSRARMGFYCIGNASILKKAQIWQDIFGTLEAENRIGSSLPLVCQNHPTKLTQVAMAEDFRKKVPCGGCDQSCEYRLPCGHVCASFCHPDDPDHEEYECDKPCLHSCDRGDHLCPLQCVEECEPSCKVKVTKSMSDCGHVIQVSCHEFEEVTCTEPCPKSFDNCGHRCKMECGQSCLPCPEKCERRLGCSHNCYEPCGKSCTVHCKVQVQRTLFKCGHTVSMDCGEHPDEHNCKTMVTKILTKCGHQAKMFCYMPEHSDSISCKERCEKILPCDHQCPNVCGKPCTVSDMYESYSKGGNIVKDCKELVDKTYPSCSHRVKLHCNQAVSSVPCSSQCEKLLVCGHRCPNKCSKLCPYEKEDDKVIYEVSLRQKIYDNYYFWEMCREKCERMLPCGHQCPNKCGEPCPQEIPDTKRRYLTNITTNCQKPVRKKLPNCGHTVTVPCFEDVRYFTCLKKCEKVLPCGHPCPNKCSEPCPEDVVFKKSDRSTGRTKERQRPSPRDRCEVLIKKDLPCGHGTKLMPCWKAESAITCREPCRDRLGCGHKCHGDCQSCNGGMQHKSCTAKCNRQLLCGHRCSEVCSIICPSDCRRCRGGTTHGTSQDSTESQPCKHNIKHPQLKTTSCIRPCNRNLPCKHPCIGVCGEPCPPFCNVCNKKIVRANLPKGRTQARDLFIYLPDCKHLCEMRYLDRMVATTKSSLERYFKIHSLLCPKCNEPIGHCPRYDDILKIVRESINEARRKCLNKRDRFRGNRVDIPPASAGATANVSFEVGRWMRCPEGHVFCQDKNDEQPDKHKPRCPECPQ